MAFTGPFLQRRAFGFKGFESKEESRIGCLGWSTGPAAKKVSEVGNNDIWHLSGDNFQLLTPQLLIDIIDRYRLLQYELVVPYR